MGDIRRAIIFSLKFSDAITVQGLSESIEIPIVEDLRFEDLSEHLEYFSSLLVK